MSANMRLFLIGVMSVAALATAAHVLRAPVAVSAAATTPERQTEAAPPARIATRVMALGRIEPVSELVRVGAPAAQDSGRLAEIRIKEGDWVERGDVIATLDTGPRLKAALRQAEATLTIRRAALAKLSADLDNQEKTLTAALEQQEAQRDRAKWDFERLQQLQKSGVYRDTALIDKRLAMESANFVLESARLTLQRNQKREVNGMRIDEIGAQAEVMHAEAAVAKAMADLEFSSLRAPISGRIVRRMGRPGEQIGTEGFAEIADTRVMYVRAELFEGDLRHVTVGAAASVSSRALDDPLTGVVERLGLKVNRQSIIGEDPAAALDARVVDVLVRLDDGSSRRASRMTGLQVRVSFATGAGS